MAIQVLDSEGDGVSDVLGLCISGVLDQVDVVDSTVLNLRTMLVHSCSSLLNVGCLTSLISSCAAPGVSRFPGCCGEAEALSVSVMALFCL